MNQISSTLQIWLLALVICAAGVTVSFFSADMPVAIYFSRLAEHIHVLSKGLGSAILLSGEATVIVVLVIARLVHGKLSRAAEALGMACLTSICAYGINANVLKIFFGVPDPFDVMHGARHAFNILDGSPDSSFPSGHMVLAGAFAGVFMRLYRASVWALSLLLLLAAVLLIVGDWHFLSDVIAGSFIGTTAGLLAGELWKVHSGWNAASKA
jgi:membrane-associated phospholipid phosphatase